MMKKLLIVSAVAAALSANVFAQESNKENKKWVAGFIEYYSTDHGETGFPDYLDNGYGFGIEYGYKFTPEWAARIEASSLRIDSVQNPANRSHEDGSRVGFDAMYFMSDFYAFGGVKYTEIAEGDVMANIGLGKHWDTESAVKIVTEVAAYKDFGGDSATHLGFKVGLSYPFGGSPAPMVPKDSDNDGVMDGQDKCQFTPAGTRVDATGCAIVVSSVAQDSDQDRDGVMDSRDNCANTPIGDKVDANGCSIFSEEEVSTDLRVLFGNNSSVISNPNDAKFQEFADFMKRFPDTDTVIEGHASAPGDADYNMMLSKKRAQAVRTLLINDYGIDADRITAIGFGETQLLDTSNTAAANKANRRITAKVTASKRVRVQK